MDTGQGFMRYDNEIDETALFQSNDNMNQAFAAKLGLSLDDTFAYVYGLLNSREYQEKYANDLKKRLSTYSDCQKQRKNMLKLVEHSWICISTMRKFQFIKVWIFNYQSRHLIR